MFDLCGGDLFESTSLVLETVAHFVISLIAVIYTWFANSSKAQRKELESLWEKVREIEVAHTRTSEEVEHLPQQVDIRELTASVSRLTGEVSGFREDIGRVEGKCDRIDNFLRESR